MASVGKLGLELHRKGGGFCGGLPPFLLLSFPILNKAGGLAHHATACEQLSLSLENTRGRESHFHPAGR